MRHRDLRERHGKGALRIRFSGGNQHQNLNLWSWKEPPPIEGRRANRAGSRRHRRCNTNAWSIYRPARTKQESSLWRFPALSMNHA